MKIKKSERCIFFINTSYNSSAKYANTAKKNRWLSQLLGNGIQSFTLYNFSVIFDITTNDIYNNGLSLKGIRRIVIKKRMVQAVSIILLNENKFRNKFFGIEKLL